MMFSLDLLDFLIIISIVCFVSLIDLVERWACNIYISTINKRTQISEEECKEKCSDVRTVDIGICHDDDLMISELACVKFITDTCTECHNDRLKLLVGIYLIDTCLLNIEHLTPEREDCLILSLSSLLCRSACGVSLYDEDLTELCFIGLAVSKLSGK